MKRPIIWIVVLAMLVAFVPTSAWAVQSNAEYTFNYFVQRGYSQTAAAAIVGNIMWESGSGGSFNFPLHTEEAGSKIGIGMCQWSYSRRTSFENYCQSKGVSWKNSTLLMQCEFLEKELKGDYGAQWLTSLSAYSSNVAQYRMTLAQFKQVNDIDKATGAFCFCFERPNEAKAHLSERKQYARNVYNAFAVIHDRTLDSTYTPYTPFKAYPISTGTVTVYDVNGNAYPTSGSGSHYIAGSTDLCTIQAVYTDGMCSVSYPTSKGSFEAYAKLSDFIASPSPQAWSADRSYDAFARSDMASRIGSVDAGDHCLVVSSSGNRVQVIYPVTGTGTCKMGWIDRTPIPISVPVYPTPLLCYAADSGHITVYDGVNGSAYPTSGSGAHYIDGGTDLCTIEAVYDGGWCRVNYPTSSGSFTAYAPLSVFRLAATSNSFYHSSVSDNTDVYTTRAMSTKLGTIYPSDDIIIVGRDEDALQVVYPVTVGSNAGKYKVGWMPERTNVKKLTGIAVTKLPDKTVYLEGETFSPAGMIVTASFDNGSSEAVTSYTLSGFTGSPGDQLVTVSYTCDGITKTAAVDVVVKAKSPVKLELTSQPSKLNYKIGETLDISGMTVKVSYDNGTSAAVTDYEVFGFDSSAAGHCTVIVLYSFNGMSVETSFNVNVESDTKQGGALTVGTVTGRPGETVSVPVSLSGNPGIIAALLKISYNSSALTLVKAEDGGILGSHQFSENLSTVPYTVLWENGASLENFTGNGTLLTLTFRISPDAAQKTYPVTLTYDPEEIYDRDLNRVNFTVQNGAVTVEGESLLRGDVNGDKTVDSRDCLLILQYAADWDMPEGTQVDAMDVDGLEGIDNRDAVFLLQYVAGWNVELH